MNLSSCIIVTGDKHVSFNKRIATREEQTVCDTYFRKFYGSQCPRKIRINVRCSSTYGRAVVWVEIFLHIEKTKRILMKDLQLRNGRFTFEEDVTLPPGDCFMRVYLMGTNCKTALRDTDQDLWGNNKDTS